MTDINRLSQYNQTKNRQKSMKNRLIHKADYNKEKKV